MVAVVSADSMRGRDPRGTGSIPVGHPVLALRENAACRLAWASRADRKSVAFGLWGLDSLPAHPPRRPARQEQTMLMRWLVAVLGLLGLGAGLLYRTHKRVRVPHRWYV